MDNRSLVTADDHHVPRTALAQLRPGDRAPGFELPDADLNVVRLADVLGDNHLVIYFYPKDDTPGCTTEALEFSELELDFRDSEALVLGISRDDCMAHGIFRDKHGLAVQLLSDVDGEVCRSYGVLYHREYEGQTRECVRRSTFVIDRKGVVQHALYGVSPRGHASEVLRLIKEL